MSAERGVFFELEPTIYYWVTVKYANKSYMRLTLGGEDVEIFMRDVKYVNLEGNARVFTDLSTGETFRISKRLKMKVSPLNC